MPSVSDHVRRDAQHAARSLIAIELARYRRRMEETANTEINQLIDGETNEGRTVDGTRVGAHAANSAIVTHIGHRGQFTVIDGDAAETAGIAAAQDES